MKMNNNINMQKIDELLAKLSKACGLEERSEENLKSSFGADDLAALQAGEAEALSKYLSYRDFDSKSGLFFGDEDIIGFMLELSPIVGVSDALLKNLNLFFNQDLPENSFLQFLLVANHDIGGIVSKWQEARISDNPLLQKLTANRGDFLLKNSTNFKDQDGRLPRNFQIFVSFSKKMKIGEMANIGSIKQIEDFKAKLLAKFSSFKLKTRLCGAEDLILLASNLLQMKPCASNSKKAEYDKYNPLSCQILAPLQKLRLTNDSITNEEDFVTRVYYVSQLPNTFSLSKMVSLLGLEEGHLGINARFAISYTIANDIAPAEQATLVTKGERVIHAAEQWYSRNNRDIKREAAEWREVSDLHKNGALFLTENFQILISAKAEDIATAEQNLLSIYNIHDWKIEPNKNLHLISLLSMLPMQQPIYFGTLKNFQLTKTILSHEAVAKLPIHAEWKGVPMPGVLMLGRRGQLFNWNPFYRISSGNYNACIMAASGGGKSVFLQELATTMMAQNARVFILDIGGSYENICELLGGEMVRFKNNANISLNPFASLSSSGTHTIADNIEVLQIGQYKVTKDAIIYAKSIIATMCGVSANHEKESLIEQAISEGIKKHGHDLDITKLSVVLANLDKKGAEELSTSLYPYTEHGVHGKYFNGKSNITFKKQLTVLEFEEIKHDTILLSVMIQVISMEIFLQVLCGDRKTRVIIIVDEAPQIIDTSERFLANSARTVRKYNCALITCVQNFNDLQSTPDRRAILENSTWTLILKQDEKGLSAFKESEAFKDILPLIESISLSPGKYAEVLFCATDIAVVGRLALDPYSQSLFSTDAADFKYLAEAKLAGISKDEAVERLAAEKYAKAD